MAYWDIGRKETRWSGKKCTATRALAEAVGAKQGVHVSVEVVDEV